MLGLVDTWKFHATKMKMESYILMKTTVKTDSISIQVLIELNGMKSVVNHVIE